MIQVRLLKLGILSFLKFCKNMHQKFKGVSKNKNNPTGSMMKYVNLENKETIMQKYQICQNTKNTETKLLLSHVKARQGYLKMPLRKTKI